MHYKIISSLSVPPRARRVVAAPWGVAYLTERHVAVRHVSGAQQDFELTDRELPSLAITPTPKGAFLRTNFRCTFLDWDGQSPRSIEPPPGTQGRFVGMSMAFDGDETVAVTTDGDSLGVWMASTGFAGWRRLGTLRGTELVTVANVLHGGVVVGVGQSGECDWVWYAPGRPPEPIEVDSDCVVVAGWMDHEGPVFVCQDSSYDLWFVRRDQSLFAPRVAPPVPDSRFDVGVLVGPGAVLADLPRASLVFRISAVPTSSEIFLVPDLPSGLRRLVAWGGRRFALTFDGRVDFAEFED